MTWLSWIKNKTDDRTQLLEITHFGQQIKQNLYIHFHKEADTTGVQAQGSRKPTLNRTKSGKKIKSA